MQFITATSSYKHSSI